MKLCSSWLALGLIVALAGCDAPGHSDDGGVADSSTPELDGSDADVDGGTTAPDAGTTTIAFSQPAASVEFARGGVRLQLVTTGPDPDRVELWKDGALLVVLPLPYTYDWLSDPETEGEHVFEARALRGGVTIATAERRFTIDRTGPTLVEARPSDGVGGQVTDGIVLELSEALDPASVTDASVTVRVGASGVPATRTLSADGTTVRIVPTVDTLPVDVTVGISTAVTDRAGNALATAVSHDVHYAAWAPVLPAGALPDTRYIQAIAVSGDDVYLLHTGGSYEDARVSRWDGAALIALPTLPGTPEPGSVRIAVTSTGEVVAAWMGATVMDVHVARFSSGAWVEGPVHAGADASIFRFELRIGPGDEPYVARVIASTRIETMRLTASGWVAAAAELSPGYIESFAFTLDGSTPVFAVDNGTRASLVTAALTFGAVTAGVDTCRAAHIVDVPGPGVDALLVVAQDSSFGAPIVRTRRWRGPPWLSRTELTQILGAVAPTPTGWIGASFDEVIDSEGRVWPLDVFDARFIDLFHGAPIVATAEQLYVPNLPPIAP